MIETTISLPHQPPWRAFLAKLNDDVYRKAVISSVAENISLNQQLIDSQRVNLASLRGAFSLEVSPNPSQSRAAIETAFHAIEGSMLKAIPWPPTAKRLCRPSCQWQRCIYLIHHLQKRSSFTRNKKVKCPLCSFSADSKCWVARHVKLHHLNLPNVAVTANQLEFIQVTLNKLLKPQIILHRLVM